MVNLKEKPYYLSDEDIKWVKDTISSMTIEEKIGQLFFNLSQSADEEYLKNVVDNFHVGGIRYNGMMSNQVLKHNNFLQTNSKIPLLIAANTESGGNGACNDGTFLGDPVKFGSTKDSTLAYEFGRIANKEAKAIGCNTSFAPILDINLNWRNPIISNRCYSNDAEVVSKMSIEYMKGAMSNGNFACVGKHFPGDGLDERDQHLAPSINTYSCEEWDKTFGKVYSDLIEAGLPGIMIGHITLPSYSKKFNPNLKDEEILPATVSKEILQDLLRNKLNFNGMIVTDASHMVGLTCTMKRSEVLPNAIAAGCDMFLFFNELEEDFNYMLDGYKNGIITEERLQDALERILALKASMGLHKGDLTKKEEDLASVIGIAEHTDFAKKISDLGITLVKNKDNIFPISPEKTKRIMIVPVTSGAGAGMFALFKGGKGPKPEELMKAELEAKGFEVTIYEDPVAKILEEVNVAKVREQLEGKEGLVAEVMGKSLNLYFAAKSAVKDFVEAQDLIITLANVKSYGQVTERVSWGMAKGGGQIPWYVHELPVVVVSLGTPFILSDVPQARTYINAYDNQKQTIATLVNKFVGETEFKGVDPVNAFGDIWGTNL